MHKNATLQPLGSIRRHRELLFIFALLLGLAYPTIGRGQTFRPNAVPIYISQPIAVLHSFSSDSMYSNADGAYPQNPVVVGPDGRVFGTAAFGGVDGAGVLFSVDSDGSNFQVLHTFTGGNDGGYPVSIIQLPDGTLFGTASGGGTNGTGVVYRVNPDGTQFQVVHNFAAWIVITPLPYPYNADGVAPYGLIQGADHALYGTALEGGAFGGGVVFRLQLDGTFTVLHTFSGTDGASPIGLLQGMGGALYGACRDSGANGGGDLYKLLPDGSGFTVIHNFNAPGYTSNSYVNAGGAEPYTYLVQDQSGTLYGTTLDGGTYGGGVLFKIQTDGSNYTLLHEFGGPEFLLQPIASIPSGQLVLKGDQIYGTCINGGSSNGGGVLYTIPTYASTNPEYLFEIHSFDFGQDPNNGGGPAGGLTLGPDGELYGTTGSGGSNGTGVVFRYGSKLLALSPNSAPAGSSDLTLTLQGTGFTDFSHVLWNGQFVATKKLSPQQLQATIPASWLASPGSATVQVYDGIIGATTSPLIFLIGQPQLQVHLTSVARDQSNNVIVQLTFVSTGGAPVSNLNLASAKLTDSSRNTVMATAGTGAIGNLPSGSSVTVSLTFPASVVSGRGLLRIAGTYTQGSFGSSFRVNIP
ncbi:hypothetical protein CTKA_01297 [Chthonomonas calidirosea]|uniref:IPT/TIG domain-containing protein n=1 Tax=Chthonomonas calidirosea (strain DSM 23976 / ICMP 18418 / T49) TaxID=1303518 RepID=S0EYA0_CHTCT|nr:choice-of-anchor tandem repeat GloVer-containing protein [Chthonomonas calidirosea]CCW36580.1 hypothetical protein CCALI_02792 [Chthonomonas calidirosea T49]CEK16908.1 hypothetical protein CTKA_01297 [Chthonomonas calidirosea]